MEKLTNLEEMIMKCIWDYGEEIPFLQIGKELKERYSKEYKRTSIRTYLFRLEDKEYLKVDKRGRNAYVYPIISEKDLMLQYVMISMQQMIQINIIHQILRSK